MFQRYSIFTPPHSRGRLEKDDQGEILKFSEVSMHIKELMEVAEVTATPETRKKFELQAQHKEITDRIEELERDKSDIEDEIDQLDETGKVQESLLWAWHFPEVAIGDEDA